MAKLKVEYDRVHRRAQLSISELGIAWNDIRRACEEWSTEVEENGLASLSLPWWAFLNARTAISFYVGRHNLSVEFDADSRDFLQKSKNREDSYRTSSIIPPITEAEIMERLTNTDFRRELTIQQLRNICVLGAKDAGATFSVPGAGKTTEALAFFFVKRGANTRLLVVCPKNAFAVWEEELKKCAPTFANKIIRLVGGEKNIRLLLSKDPMICLITYQQLPNVVSQVADFLTKHTSFIFVDESHRIKKGINGIWAGALLSLAHLAVHKLVLSGTPMPNATTDLIPQFQFLFPEVRVDEVNITSLIKPIYVRTTKKELNIPDINRRIISVPLSSEQQYVYNLLRSEFARQADKVLTLRQREQYRQLGRSAMRLLQFVSNPALLLSSGAVTEELLSDVLALGDSPKIAFTCNRARELAAKKKKIIIWSSFVKNIELISTRLIDIGADYIHGGVETGSEEEEDTRERKISRFHSDPDAYVLIGNPAACGESISLHTVCHHAIYVDRNFNVAQYLQSEDRIHRLGLKKDQETIVEILSSPETIDETVDARLRAKVRRMSEVLNDPNLNIDPVSFDLEDEELDDGDISALVQHLKAGVKQ